MWQHEGMANYARDSKSTVIPGMRYRDCLAAIEWLCTALGFDKRAFYMGEGKSVMHAELTFGNGMIMLGSASVCTEFSKYSAMPDELAGRETRSVSLMVSNCDAAYAQAKAAGAEIVFDLVEKEYGGKAFTCRDAEGHLWQVGDYNPWETTAKD
jgi:uncharacterized glyoxalase superfamily protein PhnB